MIKAKVIADSISAYDMTRITTLEIEVPRIVWCEALTHRMLSKGAASSRAIPFAKMVEQLKGRPVEFGKNQSGMQSAGEHDALIYCDDYDHFGFALENDEENDPVPLYHKQNYAWTPEEAWEGAKEDAVKWSKAFSDAGYHKQVVNRITEPYQIIKAVITATEWDNFFHLRDDEAADPTLQALARCIRKARDESTPRQLIYGEFHLPYIEVLKGTDGVSYYYLSEEAIGTVHHITLEEAIKCSVARCAAVSFRNTDYPLEKCLEVFDRLVGADKKHATPTEHVATPIRASGYYDSELVGHRIMVNHSFIPFTWDNGISHVDRQGVLWSGNFRSWLQFRKTMQGENYVGG